MLICYLYFVFPTTIEVNICFLQLSIILSPINAHDLKAVETFITSFLFHWQSAVLKEKFNIDLRVMGIIGKDLMLLSDS